MNIGGQERHLDTLSRRRRLLDKGRRKEFDAHYGKLPATGSARRNAGGAGKGDGMRDHDRELYEAGYLAAHAPTEDEREHWTRRWRRLRKAKTLRSRRVP